MRPDAAAPPSLPRRLLAGAGLQFLAAAPAALYQAVVELHNPLFFVFGLPVLAGGRSSIALYEATVREVLGDRRDTLMDGAAWYFCIAAAQMLLVALILAWRRRRRAGLRDPVALALLLAVGLNAAAAASWPWWGT